MFGWRETFEVARFSGFREPSKRYQTLSDFLRYRLAPSRDRGWMTSKPEVILANSDSRDYFRLADDKGLGMTALSVTYCPCSETKPVNDRKREVVDVSTAALKSSRVCLESHAWPLFGCTVFFSLHQFTLL
jgi:hypothetical protein